MFTYEKLPTSCTLHKKEGENPVNFGGQEGGGDSSDVAIVKLYGQKEESGYSYNK